MSPVGRQMQNRKFTSFAPVIAAWERSSQPRSRRSGRRRTMDESQTLPRRTCRRGSPGKSQTVTVAICDRVLDRHQPAQSVCANDEQLFALCEDLFHLAR